MKILLHFLLITVLSLTLACKEDDSSPRNFVIGTWQPFIAFGDGEFYEFSDCQKQGQVVFEADGAYSSKVYLETSVGDGLWECTLMGSATGMWEELAPNQYSISIVSTTPISQTIEILFIHQDTIRFRKDENNYADYSRL